MKISERIKENENSKINALLVAHGFERIKVEDAPFSQFYTKEINENQTQYIRKDIDTYRNKTGFFFAKSWNFTSRFPLVRRKMKIHHRKEFKKKL